MIRAIGAYTLSECMEIMGRLAAAGERENPTKRAIIFCEDRLTLIAERTLAAATGGSLRTYVTTYARALKARGRVLSKQGSVIAIDGIVCALQKQEKLRRFTRGLARGTARGLYETISQIASSAIDPETLKNCAAELESGILKDKIYDLAEVYTEYKAFLNEKGYVDESGYLALLPEYLKSTGELCGADVYFLCYGSFTAQAVKTLKAAFETAANVTGIFCFGEEELYCGAARRAFLRAAEEYARELDISEKVRILNYGEPLDGAAEKLRKGLFDPSSFSPFGKRYETEAVGIYEAEDKNEEMARVAIKIKKHLAADCTIRYRDFAVLVSDLKGYAAAVKKAFSEYNIPCFFDEKRSLRSHPLSQFILSCFDVVRTGFAPDAVDTFLQNPFFEPTRSARKTFATLENFAQTEEYSPLSNVEYGVGRNSDVYRNYLLKYANYRGGAIKEIKNFSANAEAINAEEAVTNEAVLQAAYLRESRERLIKITAQVKRRARGEEYCAAVREILRISNAAERLAELSEKIKDVALNGYLNQIDGALERVLNEMGSLLTGREMSVSEFSDMLADGLEATEISLIPVKTDAVFVGDITDSRIEKVRVLFAVGMDQSVPKSTSDAALISDREMEKLAEVKAKMEPTVAEVNLRSREDTALNLCTFTQAIYFSYSASQDGSENVPSEVLKYVNALFSKVGGADIPVEKGESVEDFIYRCSSPVPALREWYILRERDNAEQCFFGEKCNSLEQSLAEYEARNGAIKTPINKAIAESENVEKREVNAAQTARGFAADAAQNESAEEDSYIDCGEKLFFHGGKLSPSAIETYFNCPFKHFMERGLHLAEREEQSVMATDSGNFIHTLLEKAAQKFNETKTEGEIRELAQKITDDLIKKPPYCYSADTDSGAYAQRRLVAEGIEAVAAAFRQVKNSLYHVAETEKKIETEEFRGKIDRVDTTDEFIRIIDYKTGKIDSAAKQYYMGKKIQLQLYMEAAKGDKIPAGVFYFPASLSFNGKEEKPFRMRGFFVGDEDALAAGDPLMCNSEKGTESEYFAMKKAGSTPAAMDRLTFSNFIRYSVYAADGARKEIKEGYIGVSPATDSCKYCPYGGACGFHPDKTSARDVDYTVSLKQIASIVSEIEENGGGIGENSANAKTAKGGELKNGRQ